MHTLRWDVIYKPQEWTDFIAAPKADAYGSRIHAAGYFDTWSSSVDVAMALNSTLGERSGEAAAAKGLYGSTIAEFATGPLNEMTVKKAIAVGGFRFCLGTHISPKYTEAKRIPGTRFSIVYGGSKWLMCIQISRCNISCEQQPLRSSGSCSRPHCFTSIPCSLAGSPWQE